MGNGYAEPKRLLLGAGELYIDDVFVGNVKGGVDFKYTPGYAFQRPGNMLADVKGERTSELVTMSAKICDFKISQLRRALGINEAVYSGSMRLRKRQSVKLSGTSNVTLTETAIAGTMKVSKLDRATTYISSTDYSATATTVARKTGGAITAGQYVIVEYDFNDTAANAIKVGGEKTTPNTFEVNFVHEASNGKLVQITLYKAMSVTDLSIAFNDKSSGDFTMHDVNFRALVDLTKPEGNNLFEIIEEDPTA